MLTPLTAVNSNYGFGLCHMDLPFHLNVSLHILHVFFIRNVAQGLVVKVF